MVLAHDASLQLQYLIAVATEDGDSETAVYSSAPYRSLKTPYRYIVRKQGLKKYKRKVRVCEAE